ncbi:hypothetical protein, partial [Alistipes sp.]|uniref:hypothetical protein n=1 Tax=Alistipes sp. TaxID=1872444 RepID=UPI00307E4C85
SSPHCRPRITSTFFIVSGSVLCLQKTFFASKGTNYYPKRPSRAADFSTNYKEKPSGKDGVLSKKGKQCDQKRSRSIRNESPPNGPAGRFLP